MDTSRASDDPLLVGEWAPKARDVLFVVAESKAFIKWHVKQKAYGIALHRIDVDVVVKPFHLVDETSFCVRVEFLTALGGLKPTELAVCTFLGDQDCWIVTLTDSDGLRPYYTVKHGRAHWGLPCDTFVDPILSDRPNFVRGDE